MTDALTPEEWAGKAQEGDSTAKARLFYVYKPRLELYITPRLTNEIQGVFSAEDIASEVLIRSFLALEQGKYSTLESGGFEQWLFRIARNHILDLVNKGGKNKPRRVTKSADAATTIATVMGVLPGNEKTPTKVMKQRDWEQALEAAIASLPEDYQTVVILRHYDKLKWEEIADRMGSTVDSVRGMAKRANVCLRESLVSLSRFITHC